MPEVTAAELTVVEAVMQSEEVFCGIEN